MIQHKIHILPDHIANKIAAGEVIQRPESVVKELLENSLDAGSKDTAVVIKDGGKKLIQVVDDGTGMDEQDAVASFLRHATSKIASYEDLEEITTYGFRGEALASIAAVAQVTMKTRCIDDEAAVVVHIDGGGTPRVTREGREPGTSVFVQNLFYNVAARRKFLKSTNTEFRHVYDAVQRVALSHPEIAMRFVSDDETILDLKAETLQGRVLDIFGERQLDGMIWFEEKSEVISLHGYIGKPTFGQKSRANQYLFLNRRYIVNRNINHAVFSAYENLLVKGSFPFFLLFLDIDPRRVDVNVHPSKMEAKFDDEQNIYRFVSTVAKKALAVREFVPALSFGGEGTSSSGIGLGFTDRQHSWPSAADIRSITGFEGSATIDRATGEIILSKSVPDGTQLARQLLLAQEDTAASAERAHVVWQLHNKYILTPIENGLMIIDQHVAHERVLYERVLERFDNTPRSPQQVLFPFTLELTAGDHALVIELLPYFEKLGFAIKPFGKNTVMIEGVPPDLRQGSNEKIIEEILSLYKEYHQESPMEVRDNLAKSFSCKAAIKAGDKLSEQQMKSLIDQLFSTKMPFVCPHGRPIVLKISTEEFDRRFGRT